MLYLIYFVHILIILFTIFAAFTNIPGILSLHIVFTISLLTHWYLNDSMCSLTLIEAYLRKVDPSETFIYRLINPIYKIDKYYLNKLIWITTILMLSISCYKLYTYIKSVDNLNIKNFFLLKSF